MSPSSPFVARENGSLDFEQIRAEALPLAGLIMLFAGLALVPFFLAAPVGVGGTLGRLFTLVAQLVAAVGTGIVLIYVVARGVQLAEA